MIFYPKLKAKAPYRQRLETFKGYDRSERMGNGAFYDMENLTSDDYPVLSVRKRRGLVKPLERGCKGMFYVPEKGLFYLEDVGGNSILQLLSEDGSVTQILKLNPNPKRFALMGNRLVIVPEMRWVDLDSMATGTMAESWEVHSGEVAVQMCDADGQSYQNVTAAPEPPANPGYHQLWMSTAVGNVGLYQYEPASSEWVSIASTYLKITGLGDHNFQTGDGVEISGLCSSAVNLNGSYVIHKAGHGDIIISGLIYELHKQDCGENPVTIERKVPALDFVVECGNRLWGCAANTNEIYACKLGDFTNWNCFQGLSTDSWVGSVGTPGGFTGAVVQNGYPVFYKETCKHKVWPSATGAHQITSVPCDGVKKGCENSLSVRDGTVFYQSVDGVRADDGGGPVEIGQALGQRSCQSAAGAVFGRKYYLAQKDTEGNCDLFVYDLTKGLWHREDSAAIGYFAAGDGRLYADPNGSIRDLSGNFGTLEEAVSWMAVTGDLGLETPEQKYISRLTLRLSLEPGATLEVYAQYDREQTWVKLGQVYGTDLRSFSLPIRPRRCDQLRLKLQGRGMCKLYALTKTIEKGSELS